MRHLTWLRDLSARVSTSPVLREARATYELLRRAVHERVYLTALFLFLAFPWIVRARVAGRERPASPGAAKVDLSPFVYAMQ